MQLIRCLLVRELAYPNINALTIFEHVSEEVLC
jgi:hypothetical protein